MGIMSNGGGTVVSVWSNDRVPIPGRNPESQAGKFRAHPQSGASIGHAAPSLEWTSTYDNVNRTGIEVIDHSKEG